MATETTLRRRGRAPQATESSTTEVVEETSADSRTHSTQTNPTRSTKSVPELLAEESKQMSNFVLLATTVALFFAFMIKSTQLPPPGLVYGVMIDAGSTGTRVQVFTFQHEKSSKSLKLHNTEMISTKKTLASLGEAGSASAFFKPLLEKAKKAVPGMRRRKRTPIALRATAGLRLIGETLAEQILAQTRTALNASEFLFKEEWVSMMEEEDEAKHAWTTLNYLKGALGQEGAGYHGALDLGGASMQIVYKKDEDMEDEEDTNVDDESVTLADTTVELFGKSHDLHSISHLGLGLFDFTKKLYTIFEKEGVLEEGNPCFRKDKVFENKKLRFGVSGSEESRVVTMTGDGDFERCVASAEIAIATYSKLYKMNSKLPTNIPFYAFAFFYDRTVLLGLPATPTKKQLVGKGKQLCEASPEIEVKGDYDEGCAEFSYIYALLKEFTNDFSAKGPKIRFEQYVDGHMLGWAFGAMLETLQPVMHGQLTLDQESFFMQ